jgi:branched-chain amino acid transport system permease protein
MRSGLEAQRAVSGADMTLGRRAVLALVLLALGVALPFVADTYLLRLVTKMLILSVGAISVDILLGYAGLVSFGHAAFVGIGAYVAGVLTLQGYSSAFFVWPGAVAAAAAAGLVIGALSLRAIGIYFIMITLAFTQMVFYLLQSLRSLGGDDGFPVPARNTLGPLNLGNHTTFYYVVLAVLALVTFGGLRVVGSRFGEVIKASRDNVSRLSAIGLPPYPYRLMCFVISAAIAGLCGALFANHTQYVTPASASWYVSGELLVMVILGSSGTIIGPILGAIVYITFEQILSDYTDHWMIILGPMLIARVLLVRDGLFGLLMRGSQPR